jgi:hypothetical protein
MEVKVSLRILRSMRIFTSSLNSKNMSMYLAMVNESKNQQKEWVMTSRLVISLITTLFTAHLQKSVYLTVFHLEKLFRRINRLKFLHSSKLKTSTASILLPVMFLKLRRSLLSLLISIEHSQKNLDTPIKMVKSFSVFWILIGLS